MKISVRQLKQLIKEEIEAQIPDMTSQEMIDLVANEYLAGRVVDPALLIGSCPPTGHQRWTWETLQSNYKIRSPKTDWAIVFRKTAHTLHLEFPDAVLPPGYPIRGK